MVAQRRRQWHPTPVLLPGKSPGWRNLVGCSPWGHWELDMTQWLHFHFSLSCIGEGNGNPLQCSCLENPRDGGASCAAVYGIAQSRTWLKRLSSSSSSMVAQMVKNLPSMQEIWVLITRSGRSLGEGNGKPLQYSCLNYSMDRRARQATVHGIAKSWTGLSDFHFMQNYNLDSSRHLMASWVVFKLFTNSFRRVLVRVAALTDKLPLPQGWHCIFQHSCIYSRVVSLASSPWVGRWEREWERC